MNYFKPNINIERNLDVESKMFMEEEKSGANKSESPWRKVHHCKGGPYGRERRGVGGIEKKEMALVRRRKGMLCMPKKSL